MYYNCFLTMLWRLKCEINLIVLVKPSWYMIKNQDKNLNILKTKKKLLRWNKKHFSSILKGFQLPKWSQTWECTFNSSSQFNQSNLITYVLNDEISSPNKRIYLRLSNNPLSFTAKKFFMKKFRICAWKLVHTSIR